MLLLHSQIGTLRTSLALVGRRHLPHVALALTLLAPACTAANQESTPAPGGSAPDGTKAQVSTTSPSQGQAGMPESPSGYYGVYTTSNVVLFGKLAGVNDDWITLTDVYYVRSNVTEERQVANQLVKRASEWHAPQESAIARQNILVIEPVAQESRMMTMIREGK